MLKVESPSLRRNSDKENVEPEELTIKCTICGDQIPVEDLEIHKCESALEKSFIDVDNFYESKDMDMKGLQLGFTLYLQPIKKREKNTM